MMRKKIIALAIAVIAIMTVVLGASFAYTQISGTPVDTQINTKSLSISLNSASVPKSESVTLDKLVPGDTSAKAMSVSNTADTTLYTRVTIDKCWGTTTDGTFIKDTKADGSLITLNSDKMDGWIVFYEDDEQIVLYYTKPLAAGEATSDVLSGITVSKDADNSYNDKSIQLTVTADAVQSYDASTAMLSAWGVQGTFAADGTLTGVTD